MEAKIETRIETHREALLRAALRLTRGDGPSSEDAVQETFIKALRNADRFEPGTNLRAWLLRILHNTVMSVHRHRKVARETPFPEGFEPSAEAAADFEPDPELLKAVEDLPEDFRKVLLMSAVDESPYQEIAATLGIPVGTVMSRLWRARQSVRRRLALN